MSKYKVKCKSEEIDVYDVINAYNISCPGSQHALKKILKPGQRGFKNFEEDIKEAIISLERAIEINRENNKIENNKPFNY